MIFDPASPAMCDDPFLFYRDLRDNDPAHYSEKFSTWVLSRYDDVRISLMDHETYCSGQGVLLGTDPESFLPTADTTDPP